MAHRLVVGLLALVSLLGASSVASASTHIPVVACHVTSGAGPVSRPPRSASTQVAPSLAHAFSFYAVGPLLILAPRSWHCDGGLGADGSMSVTVYNPHAGFFPTAVNGYQPQQAVTAQVPSAGTNGPLFLACTFFADAAYALRQSGNRCGGAIPMPLGERDSRAGLYLHTFADPPGVSGNGSPSGGRNPANGFVTWYPAADNHGLVAAVSATCTLPQAAHATCTAILNDFLRRWGRR